jgi:dipeptidyl aminopeptidase/acylaminoacyl peptidase
MRAVQYTSRDGLTIHGYLTLPRFQAAKSLPVVVNPHGGPWQRDTWSYNPEVQFLASRGYAVFQINFRGSTGYGRNFWQASFKQWGKAMQDDLTDGVAWLIGEGIAHPKRIAIYGASYGGYASLAGVTFTPALYAAAIVYVGVSNLFTFLDSGDDIGSSPRPMHTVVSWNDPLQYGDADQSQQKLPAVLDVKPDQKISMRIAELLQ